MLVWWQHFKEKDLHIPKGKALKFYANYKPQERGGL